MKLAKIVKMEEKHLPEVALLCQRNLPFDRLPLSALAQQIYCDKEHDPELALVAMEGGKIVGFCLGVLRRATSTGWVKVIVVDQPLRHQGMGTQLLSRLEKLLGERGAREIGVGGSAPRYIWPGVDLRYTEALIFFERRGYKRQGFITSMVVDLSRGEFDPSEREGELRREGIEIRRARPEEEGKLRQFIHQHFSPHWAEETAVGLRNIPPSVFVALKEGEIIGFAAYDVNNLGTGFFGPTGVHPDFRRKGIGGALLLHCLRDIKAQGLKEATISWTNLFHYYHTYTGALVGRVFVAFRKKLG